MNPQITQAAKIIQAGGIVAFPTETVYGLGANALDPIAVSKIFTAKNRPAKNPLIVHISDLQQLNEIAVEIPDIAKKLIDKFWPGPLSIILQRKQILPDIVTAGLDTFAVRMPSHPLALELIKAAKLPIAAPSANTSGRPSPTHHDHVIQDLGDKVDMVIEGGATQIGLESTVINVLTSTPIILRHGGISQEEIEKLIGQVDVYNGNKTTKVISPGMAFRHYAPDAKLFLLETDQIKLKVSELTNKDISLDQIGILTVDENLNEYPNELEKISLGSLTNLDQIAANLFDSLLKFNSSRVKFILAEKIPERGIGRAIMDRLRRAAE